MRPIQLKPLIIICMIAQAGILFFLFQLPNPLDALWLQLTYSPETFKSIVLSWSTEHLNFYLLHYYLDFIHPLIYGSLLLVLLKTLKIPLPRAVFFLPVVGALGDEVENICNLFLILNPDDFSKGILWVGATASWVKWISLLITLKTFIPRVQREIIKISKTSTTTHQR